MPDAISLLTAWDSYYVIIGSSSGALTGLMFVVVTLVPEARTSSPEDGISAFGTPTVVHFCAALLVSVILSAPWGGLFGPAVAASVIGSAGLVYDVIVWRRARRQTDYTPVFEDWLWHVLMPLIAYLTLVVAGMMLTGRPAGSLFGVAAATALLLFIGIHNAWDAVTYIAFERRRGQN